jgi:alanine racemase
MKHNYRTWITIDKSALLYNCKKLAQLIAPQKLALVIKGNAYGHGLLQVAQCTEQSSYIALLCVAFLREAHKLRSHGISKKIMVLCAIDDNLDARWCDTFIFLVDDLQTIYQLNHFAKHHNKIITIHLKIDIGLSRRGFLPIQIKFIFQQLKSYLHIRLVGICSHLSNAKTDKQLTQDQLQNFDTLITQLKKVAPLQDVHITNSSSLFYQTPQATLIRIGLMAYGYNSLSQHKNKNINLKPVLAWHTRIMHIKNLPANVGVGYDHTFITKRPTRIALLPIGYADGYPQELSNRGCVLINNKITSIIGTISMNITIVDITTIDNVHINDQVTLLDQFLSAEELIHINKSTNIRKFLVAIDPTIPRIIID